MEDHLTAYAIVLYVLFNIAKTFFKEKNQDIEDSILANRENTVALKILSERIDKFTRFPEDVKELGLFVRELRTKVEFLEKMADKDI